MRHWCFFVVVFTPLVYQLFVPLSYKNIFNYQGMLLERGQTIQGGFLISMKLMKIFVANLKITIIGRGIFRKGTKKSPPVTNVCSF